MSQFTYYSDSIDATRRLGQVFSRLAESGLVVCLNGALGAGKTAFVRSVAEGLGIVDRNDVTSPTFVLIQEYEAKLPIYHFDAYRLADVDSFAELGVHEYFEGDGICFVEWAERVNEVIPHDCISMTIEITGETQRMFLCEGVGHRSSEIVRCWNDELTSTTDR